jgi:tetratricopeptide (TPR) repeat protein
MKTALTASSFCVLAASLVLLSTAPAWADSAANANAGMDALGRGDYATAVALFSQAISAGDLSPADQESAYLERGHAYLGERRYDLAQADFRQAIKLRPDDDAAMAGLELSLKKQQAQADAATQAQAQQAQAEADARARQAQAEAEAQQAAAAPPPLTSAALEGTWTLHLCAEMGVKGEGRVNFFAVTPTSARMSGSVRTTPVDIQAFQSAQIDGLSLDMRAINIFVPGHWHGRLVSPVLIQSIDSNCNWHADKR